MRNKLIMIIAMLAVMVAMTGIAAALPYDAFIWNELGTGAAPNPIILLNGENKNFSYRGENIIAGAFGVPLPYSYLVSVQGGAGDGAVPADITVTFTHTNFVPTGSTTTDVGVINIARSATAPASGKYRITIRAGDEATSIDFGSASRNTEVPEFPTVALPIAAVLGLVFFFQQKKRKEE